MSPPNTYGHGERYCQGDSRYWAYNSAAAYEVLLNAAGRRDQPAPRPQHAALIRDEGHRMRVPCKVRQYGAQALGSGQTSLR